MTLPPSYIIVLLALASCLRAQPASETARTSPVPPMPECSGGSCTYDPEASNLSASPKQIAAAQAGVAHPETVMRWERRGPRQLWRLVVHRNTPPPPVPGPAR
ncbi:MAG: hypothetical protein WC661_12040 [Opitutaceae bacterium]